MPISSVALVDGDVAMPPDNVVVPTTVPSALQSPPLFPTSSGLHKKNFTVPVGTGDGATAKSVALSDTVDPGITSDALVLDCVLNGES